GLAAGLRQAHGPHPTIDPHGISAHTPMVRERSGFRSSGGSRLRPRAAGRMERMRTEYETVEAQVDTEVEISRSRFLTRLVRVDAEHAARYVIAQVRAEHPRARHHCSAFVLGPEGRVQRSTDDGEPSGTAGAPMLDA